MRPSSSFRRHPSQFTAVFFGLASAAVIGVAVLSAAEPAEVMPEAESKRDEGVRPTAIPLDKLMEIPLVEAVSKRAQPLAEAPSSVTIVTGEEAKLYGHRTLGDMLRSVRGLHVSYDRTYQFLGTRGFNRGDFNSRMLVLVDGHRVNSSLTDGAFIGTGFVLDVDLIDRVEIVRGPGSVLYGNNAFFGVINVITRKGEDFGGSGVELSSEVAGYGTYKERVSVGHAFENGVSFVGSATLYRSEGDRDLHFEAFDTPPTSDGVARDLDRDDYESFFGTVSYKELSLQGAYISRLKEVPTAPGTTAFNAPQERLDERGYANIRYGHEFPDGTKAMARVYYDRAELEATSEAFFGGLVSEERRIGEWWGAELQLTRELFDRLTVTVGGEYRDDFHQRAKTVSPGFVSVPNRRGAENYGVYVQGDFNVLTNLQLSAGVRYDQYEQVDSTVNPRLALIYSPVPKTVLKAIYGTAFRAPSFEEIVVNQLVGIGAEEITTYELVLEQGIGEHYRLSLGGFYNEIDDLIVREGQAFRNADAEAEGMEFGLEGFWASGLRVRLSYTLQEVEDRMTGKVLTDAPKHLAKVNVVLPLYRDKVFAGLEYQYTSSRKSAFIDLRSPSPTPPSNQPGRDAAGFGVLNATLYSKDLVPGLTLSASIYNLLDNEYDDPSTPHHLQDLIPQYGRNFRVQLSYRF